MRARVDGKFEEKPWIGNTNAGVKEMYVRLGPGYPYGQECHQVYYYRRFEDTGVHK